MRFSDFIWLVVIVIAVLLVRWYQTGDGPWKLPLPRLESNDRRILVIVAAAAAALALLLFINSAIAPARAASGCAPEPVERVMLDAFGQSAGKRVETIAEPAQVAALIAVLNQVPPPHEPADRVLLLVLDDGALIGFVRADIVCERLTIDGVLLRAVQRALGTRA